MGTEQTVGISQEGVLKIIDAFEQYKRVVKAKDFFVSTENIRQAVKGPQIEVQVKKSIDIMNNQIDLELAKMDQYMIILQNILANYVSHDTNAANNLKANVEQNLISKS